MQDSETPLRTSSSHSGTGKRKGTPIKSISKEEFLNDFEKKAMGIIQLNFTREHKRLHSPSSYSSTFNQQRDKKVFTHREFGWIPRYGGSDDESYSFSDNQPDTARSAEDVSYSGPTSSGKLLIPNSGGQSYTTPRARSSAERAVLTPSQSGNLSVSNTNAQLSRRQTSPLFKRAKRPNPLDISDAQGVRELNSEEYELCTTLRILPTVYFHARKTLIENSRIRGFYKKSAAQKMLRIDVNKTGKLYDYFYSKGWLPQEPGIVAPITLDEPGLPLGIEDSDSAQTADSTMDDEVDVEHSGE